ncbi:MAG: hypothetical protein LYZ69_01650 [Nitrososphaerales archaeon]|nr:hypothetical protein [Nitrososphaerales archaeon]
MRRVISFLLLLVGAVVVSASLVAWYIVGYEGGNASMAGMMGQMMGSNYGSSVKSPMPSYVWLGLSSLLVLMIAGVGGLAYYLVFPEIRSAAVSTGPAEARGTAQAATESWAALLRTSKPEEKRVLEVLASHGGRYLQKFVVKEAGLSRLQTHRIVSRFAERGIVIVSKSGNTNELSLASWLRPDAVPAGTT